jgi:bla regulator protein BlaR1
VSALLRRRPAPAPAGRTRAFLRTALGAAFLAAAGPLPAAAFSHGLLDDGFEYALYDPRTDQRVTFLSSADSWRTLERELRGEKVPLFWFSDEGRSWLVRDPATVAEARRILAPIHDLARKQGKLGAKQGALGARQGKLGAEQGRLGARQAMLGVRLGGLVPRPTRGERRRLEAEIEKLGREQDRLGRLQEPLGEQQRVLGEQQEELGRRQASASKKAGVELRRLARHAREDGRARRVD